MKGIYNKMENKNYYIIGTI